MTLGRLMKNCPITRIKIFSVKKYFPRQIILSQVGWMPHLLKFNSFQRHIQQTIIFRVVPSATALLKRCLSVQCKSTAMLKWCHCVQCNYHSIVEVVPFCPVSVLPYWRSSSLHRKQASRNMQSFLSVCKWQNFNPLAPERSLTWSEKTLENKLSKYEAFAYLGDDIM